jgi:3-dehydroquinate synthase
LNNNVPDESLRPMKRIPVRLGDRSYDIAVAPGLLGRLGPEVRRVCPSAALAALVTDRHVAARHLAAARRSLERAGFRVHATVLPPGERTKTLATVARLYAAFAVAKLERSSPAVLLGGGVIGDLGGFAAATYLRGLPIVQVPTSLVAQVDAAIGGKTGVDLPQGKNLVGAFAQPRAVLIDPLALRTLPRRELIAGLAEVVKYGVIRDAALFAFLESRAKQLAACPVIDMAAIVARCAAIKAEVVSKDERESGLRQILNYGHTIGHAIEAATGYTRFLHGEAVAVGMTGAALMARLIGTARPEVLERQSALLLRLGLPLRARGVSFSRALAALRLDKKVLGGRPRFVLPVAIGRVRFGQSLPPDMVEETIRLLTCP